MFKFNTKTHIQKNTISNSWYNLISANVSDFYTYC